MRIKVVIPPLGHVRVGVVEAALKGLNSSARGETPGHL